MAARPVFHSVSRRTVAPVPPESAVASGPRPAALLLVIAVALLLMVGPAVVGGLSMVDADLLKGSAWADQVSTWLSYLARANMFLALPFVAMVARTEEDQ
jgi:hypothetical protein